MKWYMYFLLLDYFKMNMNVYKMWNRVMVDLYFLLLYTLNMQPVHRIINIKMACCVFVESNDGEHEAVRLDL